jgi:dienelactone hydrolase
MHSRSLTYGAWLLAPFTAVAACGGGNSSPGPIGTGENGNGASSSGTGSGGGSSSNSSTASSGNSSNGGNSNGGNPTGSSSGSPTGSSGSGPSSGSGGSGGSGGGSSSSGTSSGASGDGGGSTGSCTAFQRGAAPTSDSAAAAGPYTTMQYAANASIRMTDAYDVTDSYIYYPVGATAPFAIITIVPGFTAAESSIADWGPFLASWGFVVIGIGTSDPTTGAPDTSVLPAVRAAAVLDALTTLTDENTRSGSPLKGQLEVTCQAVAGWSMGGGGALIAANETASLAAEFSMEPWTDTDTTPSSLYPMDTVPALIFGGTSDGLAGPPMDTDQYASIPSTTPKLIYEVTGGTHYVSTSPTNSSTDMAPDTVSTPSVARFGLSWLKLFMENDTRFKQFLLVKPSDANVYETTVM